MDTDDNPKAEAKKSTAASSMLKMVFGSVAVLAFAILAGLVFTQYEAGIPPAEAAPAIAHSRFIPVTISKQNLTIRKESIPVASRHAARAQAVPAMKRATPVRG